jgi:hypothetical protein
MKTIKHRWWKIYLLAMVMLAPAQPLCATVTQFTDEKGTIHIVNTGTDKAKPQNGDYPVSLQPRSIEVVSPNEPTPSNIFPEPAEANALASNQNFQAPAPE